MKKILVVLLVCTGIGMGVYTYTARTACQKDADCRPGLCCGGECCEKTPDTICYQASPSSKPKCIAN
jgi:hypothetical protein